MRIKLPLLIAVLFVALNVSADNINVITLIDTGTGVAVLLNGAPPPGLKCHGIEHCGGAIGSGPVATGTMITSGLGNFNIYEDAGLTTLSDTLSISQWSTVDRLGAAWDFNSVVDGTPLTPLPNATALVETGGVQLATVVNFNQIYPAIEFDFQSGPEVLEPSSLLLFGTGLAGIAGVIRRKLVK